jgi:hypothetical protein
MRTGSWLAAPLVLGAALVVAPLDGVGQTAAPAQPPQQAQPAQPGAAPQPAQTKESSTFSPEQLEQLVAPIALYPDSLLTQTLMASTYPLEIVEAARWLKKNPSLKDSALTEALKGQDWDPSVKSICGFPEVLKKMDENLDWMQDLGDAFLGQQEALLKTVQKMRGKAYESGNLKTTEQQKVTQTSETVIIIEPAQPEVIYVPTYSPTVVYGGWGYPSYYYPAYYAPYPPGAGLVTFTAGVAFGAAVWGNCDWGHNDVDIDIDRYNNFNRNTSVNAERYNRSGSGSANWEHNAEHRRGVNYQNTQTAQKYGGASGSKNVTRDQARGWNESRQPGQGGSGGTRPGGGDREPGSRPSGGGERPTTLPSGGGREPGSRPSGGGERPTTLPSGGADRPSAGTRDVPSKAASGGGQRPSTSDRSYSSSGGSKTGAYSGSSSPKADTSASSRGSSSRGSSSYSGSKSTGASRPSSSSASRPSGGGSRPSGGGGGGSRGGGGRR